MDWLAELNDTIEMESWFEIQSSDAKELRDFILEKDAEIERLREALKGLLRVADGFPMSGIEAERLATAARAALQQKETE